MTARSWTLAVVRVSDSFETTINEVAEGAGAAIVAWDPAGGPVPADALLILVLGGGAEADVAELLPSLGDHGRPVVVVGALPDHRMATTIVQQGARDYFVLPAELELLRHALEREQRSAEGEVRAEGFADAERRSSGFDAILGRSRALREVLDQAARVAEHADVTVLIHGETGTGKELLARAIHYHSPRAARPFVEINCAAIPGTLLESELFGHEKGAFTGASFAKPGLFELGDGGTIFLDEIASLPIELQPKMLRAIESRTVRRVGSLTPRQIDVRLVAATHVELTGAVRRGEFREDLYYRLNVVTLTLPSLRQRVDDIELLAEAFIARIAGAYGLPVPALTPAVREALKTRAWPGNVRELRNAIERALVLSPRGTLRAEELQSAPAIAAAPAGTLPFPAEMRAIVAAAAQEMLTLTGGNKTEAARRLGISRPRLNRILEGSAGEED
ncbi:MAG: sigma-54 interaction domain-containing protein [Bacillota bacterium]|jgi:DNA-binding NtrC family response regulator